ncbi:hypothetical protein OKJ48_20330 [Streptomyces kunmingensis]|uniref:Gram-positive cocci surface proteins LPxTG domain-containing protein n=1 Tax=Streptomyces kunmingensis TaxID=68225 RepID=A0ABU6CEL6_9ACTN|nr:hypothetical protein [Streptomyces kunmingensis]MEB3962582.1 hypothetical protein [Streptomyces kunmingensis]
MTATAATLVLSGPATATAAGEGRHSTGGAARACAAASDRGEFPITSRIHEGPAAYYPGDEHRYWSLDLTNTTDAACTPLHPVLVLVDQRRTLRSAQVGLEFFDGERWRPVRFEKTGQGDHVGVFDDGFRGFSAGPGKTVTVRVRLAFTPDTLSDHVVASAALVQRQGDDGNWVGESEDYPFDIVADGTAPDDGTGTGTGTGDGYGYGYGYGYDDGDGRGTTSADELAATGPSDTLLGLAVAAAAFLLGGGILMAGARHLRAGRR